MIAKSGRHVLFAADVRLLGEGGRDAPSSLPTFAQHTVPAGITPATPAVGGPVQLLPLAIAEQRFRATFEQAAVGLCHADPDGRLLRVNDVAARLLNQAHPAQSDATLFERLRLSAAQRAALEAVLRGRHPRFAADVQMPLDGNAVRWLHLTVSGVRLADGRTDFALVVLDDITVRKAAVQALKQSEARMRSYTEHAPLGVAVLDRTGRLLEGNAAALALAARSQAEAWLQPFAAQLHRSGRPLSRFAWRRLLRTGQTSEEVQLQRGDGQLQWITVSVARLDDGSYIAFALDIAERKREEEALREAHALSRSTQEALERLAHHDVLTTLPNRLLLMRRLTQALAQAQRRGTRGALLMLDLDRFKNVNDSLGHPAGDLLLQQVAQRLGQRVRTSDTLARLGGDEFVVLLEDLRSHKDAAQVAQALIEVCSAPYTINDDTQVFVGASVGISLFPDDGMQGDRLLQQADAAMFSAKKAGRGIYRFFTHAHTRDAQSRLALESGLRQALELEQFSVHYQPVVRAVDGSIQGVEALVRWHHPERGTISPGAFIPLAEETGLIVPLGDWVLRAACSQMKRWQDAGIAPPTLAVNLSPRQFAQHALPEQVARALSDTGLQPQCLELEITEGALMDAAEAGARLRRLKDLGLMLAIDDFGTGYSSLAYLSRFPIDKLKVDQSFVRRIPDDATDMEIASAVISLAKSLKLQVLAEGVETQGQHAFLRERGCDLLQGYLFARPMTAQALEPLLRGRRPLS